MKKVLFIIRRFCIQKSYMRTLMTTSIYRGDNYIMVIMEHDTKSIHIHTPFAINLHCRFDQESNKMLGKKEL